MLSQADVQVLSTVFGKTEEEISGALKSDEEVSLGFRLNGKVYTPEEIEEKTKANQDAYIEIGYKKIAKEAGIELDAGEKDPKILIEKLKGNVSKELEDKYKNQTPHEELEAAIKKAVEFENKFNTLNKTYEETHNSLQNVSEQFDRLQSDIKVKERNNKILSAFPEKMKMDKSDALLIINNSLEFDESDSGYVVKHNGKQILNRLGEPEDFDNAILSFIDEKGWTKSSGVGGEDRKPTGLPSGLSADDAVSFIQEKGVDPMSTEGSKMFVEITK